MKKGQLIILLLSFLLGLNACKIKKDIKSIDEGIDANTALVWNNIKESRIDYEWFYAKANSQVSFEGMTFGGKADIRIRKDSVILLSVRKFGFELFRALVRPDSIFGISRLEGSYFAMPIDSLKKDFDIPFNYQQLQDLIVGNPIIDDQIPLQSQSINNGIIFTTLSEDLRIDYVLNEDFLVYESKFMDNQGRSFALDLDKYKEFEKGISLAAKRDYSYTDKQNAEYKLSFDLEKVEINKVKKIKFEIPSSYTKM